MQKHSYIDYDLIENWSPWIDMALMPILEANDLKYLKNTDFRYVEDPSDWILENYPEQQIVEAIFNELSDKAVRLYHGTRVSEKEHIAIIEQGLKPLDLASRKDSITDVLRLHPRWNEVQNDINNVIIKLGPESKAGVREDGCIHACFSRTGLLLGCNHYLRYGAEVDGHVAYRLFGDNSARILFNKERKPLLISFEVSFTDAATYSHALHDTEDGKALLAKMLLKAWAYQKSEPDFTPAQIHDCTAAKVLGPIEASRISVQDLHEDDLGDNWL